MELKLLAIGEAMAELRHSADAGFNVGFAGDTFNTALYCSRALSSDASVGFMSRIGMDPLSQSFIDLAKGEGLNTAYISRDQDHNIGIYSVSTDGSGERSFHYWRSQSAARRMFLIDEAVNFVPLAGITYLSGITLAIMHPAARRRLMDHLKELSDAGKSLIAFDSNFRAQLWESRETAKDIISEMWTIADIALPSIDDEMDLYDEKGEGAVISRFSSREWRACAIKRGVRGPVSPSMQADAHPLFPSADKVIDTTAAGDSFNGGYLAAFIQGQSEVSCLSAGHACASRVVGFRGAIIPSDQY
ncbi:MAG: sugar kinase [Granulosicoccus sp.]